MACDICSSNTPTTTLSSQYQNTDIKDVCNDCLSDITVQHDKIRTHCIGLIPVFVKRYLKLYKFRKRCCK